MGRTTHTTTSGRRRGRLVVLLALLPALLAGPAVAHEGHGTDEGTEDGAEHARLDLAGRSVTEVERRTLANRARMRAAGRYPEAGRSAPGVAPDPARSGSWGPVLDTPVVPVFQAVLPDGAVLMWDSVGDGPTESSDGQTFTRAMVWDPRDDTYERVDVEGHNIFCAGYAQLPDGDVLVVGGNKNAALEGIRRTHVFDWRTREWSRGPDMLADRWYPSVATLATGAALVVAGGPGLAEVYDPGASTLRGLTGFESYDERLYPFLVPRLDGRVGMVGPGPRLDVMSTAGDGALEVAGGRDGRDRSYGSFATFTPGRTLVSGGSPVEEAPTDTAVVVRDDEEGGTAVTPTGPMAFRRKQHNLTVLADGSVLATGGQRTRAYGGLVDLRDPVLAAERWDPATGRWTMLASAARARQYHSTASLLPDGRVLTGGGGVCAPCVTAGYLEKNLETFTPPYLYRRDGSGRLAARPRVSGVPGSVRVATTFTATSPSAGSIRKVGLVRLGAPTHSVDAGQRYVPLSFARSGRTLTVRAPASTRVAPPGYYLLFAVDDRGVPSVASTVQVTPPGGIATAPEDLALHRPATASSTQPAEGSDPREVYEPGSAVDGSTDTRWASAVSEDEWWQVDLGATRSVGAVRTVWETAYAARYQVRTSVDGRRWRTARTVTADAPRTRRTTFRSRPARYVRIQGLARGTPYGYSLREVGVYAD
ncbi:galactose oxidase-like domain-containing protein [uncultured Nocardioides sp.]|uniref:galactose oxidase-like domain-containing protein n=1 Tax=uncultured Nocardioides sp. TaxID=198441 RepID=UPI00262A0A2C|nr:galactose oxidase-like domain-containing protein [uncultured Nocardioides sp.]